MNFKIVNDFYGSSMYIYRRKKVAYFSVFVDYVSLFREIFIKRREKKTFNDDQEQKKKKSQQTTHDEEDDENEWNKQN